MGSFDEVTDDRERQDALPTWPGRCRTPLALDDGTGVVFRLNVTEKTGRFVLQVTPSREDDFRPTLASIDLRAANEANWPPAIIGPDGAL
jgi:hypothetical protein